ncbi:MAG: hypothetical protein ACREX3_17975, partial [Gammaproteobacteria bacterium]
AVDLGSATLHESGLLRGCCCFREHIIPRSADRFLYISDHTISSLTGGLDFTHGDIQRKAQNSQKPNALAIFYR